ncbi:DUF6266 family protein [Pedobacter sp. FW305-3-2-15-E-R2A2]|uniref:DUF6266 family protein n=1 Tax=Pedobacter sp. FW305-3-2-15-E-R2A2 TaxID=3140251 RepID=UPI00314022F8
MATIKNGILGGFTGKIGSVVGYRTYGEDRMRSVSERTAPATAAELKNRKQFKLVQDTLNCIKSLIKIGFKDYWTKTGGTRGAISYNKTHAVQVNGDDCLIDPERFKFSGGVLAGLNDTTVELERPDLLRFNWSTASSYSASPKDQVMLLAIDLEGKKACYESLGNFRGSGTDVLKLDHDLTGKEVAIYIAVVAKDRSKQSDSQYLGKLRIPGPADDHQHSKIVQKPHQSTETQVPEPTPGEPDLINEQNDFITTELSDRELEQTLSHKTIEAVEATSLNGNMLTYIQKLKDQGLLRPDIPLNGLSALVYLTDTSGFEHLRLKDGLSNRFVVVVTDLYTKMVKGHYYTALKEGHGHSNMRYKPTKKR